MVCHVFSWCVSCFIAIYYILLPQNGHSHCKKKKRPGCVLVVVGPVRACSCVSVKSSFSSSPSSSRLCSLMLSLPLLELEPFDAEWSDIWRSVELPHVRVRFLRGVLEPKHLGVCSVALMPTPSYSIRTRLVHAFPCLVKLEVLYQGNKQTNKWPCKTKQSTDGHWMTILRTRLP